MRGIEAIFLVLGVLSLACGIAKGQQRCSSTIFVTALDQKTNQPIDELTVGDFHATSGSPEVSIRAVAPAPSRRRILLVLDRSGSMTTSALIGPAIGRSYDPDPLVRLILEDVLSAIPSSDAVAFLSFAGKHSDQTGFMPPSAARAKVPEILKWKPGGGTPLWDGLDSAAQMLTPHELGDAIIVISDGGDNMSKLSVGKVRKELLNAALPVFAVLLLNPSAPPRELERESFLDLVKATGGMATVTGSTMRGIDTGAILPVRPDQLVTQLTHQYELEVDSPCVGISEKWGLKIEASRSGRRARLFYPHF